MKVRDIIPNGLTLTSVSQNALNTNGVVTVSLDTLAPGASVDVTYAAKVTVPGMIVNKAELVSLAQADTLTGNNSSTWTLNNTASVDSLIGLAKAVGTVTKVQGSENIYKVPFVFTIKNIGLTDLDNVQLRDTLDLTFLNANVIDSVGITADNGLVINPAFTGLGDKTDLLIADESSIAAGATLNVRMDVFVNMSTSASNSFENSATVYAGTDNVISDVSTDGTNPDPDNDGNPANNSVPTRFTVGDGNPTYGIGAALSIIDSAFTNDGTVYEVKYLVKIQNFGKDTVSNVHMVDSLMYTFSDTLEYTIVTAPVVTSTGSTLVPNPDFDGKEDARLLLADESATLAPGQIDSVEFKVSVKYGTNFGPYRNNVIAFATDKATVLTDTSNNGKEIIKHLSTPTMFSIPEDITVNVTIPEGFSPNGDGKNDKWKIVINGNHKIENLTITNRYGTTLYEEKGDEGVVTTEGWDGKANKGIVIGGGQVPPGTYWYTIKFVGVDKKLVNYITVER